MSGKKHHGTASVALIMSQATHCANYTIDNRLSVYHVTANTLSSPLIIMCSLLNVLMSRPIHYRSTLCAIFLIYILNILSIRCNTSPNHYYYYYYYHSITLILSCLYICIFVYFDCTFVNLSLFVLFCVFLNCFIVLYCYAQEFPLGWIKFYLISYLIVIANKCSSSCHISKWNN